MRILKLLKYCFLRTRAAFCKHRFFYWWGVTGVDRHGLYCVKCEMRIQSIPGRKLKYYEYEMPPKEEIVDDGATATWTNPRKIKKGLE